MNLENTPHTGDLTLNADRGSLDSLAEEILALKMAIGLLFNRLAPASQKEFQIELRQLNFSKSLRLADELEQFRINDEA